MSPPALYSQRPQISLNGQHVPAVDARLTEMVVTHALNQPAHCRMVFSSGTNPAAGDVGAFGDALRIDAGTMSARIFSGSINAMGADFREDRPPTTILEAGDRLRALDMHWRTRVFAAARDRDAITAIASAAGLQVLFESTATEIVHDTIMQANQTDLAFIRDRAHRSGADIWLEDDHLLVRSRADWGTSPALTLTYGASLLRFSVFADLTTQASELHVTGWDVAHKDSIDQQAAALPAAFRPNSGQTGGDILAQAFGEQTASIVHTAPASAEAAHRLAQARFEAQARRFITGTGVTVDKPELHIGQVIALEGLGERYSGLYFCVGVRHRFDTNTGYRVEFDVERADFEPGETRRAPISRPGIRRPPSKRPNIGKKE